MSKRLFILLIAFWGFQTLALAQNTVSGVVVDSSGQPIIAAGVVISGTTDGTITDFDGNFSLTASPDAVLEVSSLGYVTMTVPVAGKTHLEITLQEETETIDDVIVVAFGTAKKEAYTGSAMVVKSEDIAKSQSSNVAQALNGKVAGVQLTNSSGQPGSSPSIRIRGFSSLNAGNDPLWIVDGMPYSGDLNNLNPSDIESMTVLKDAASNSLYGARGANGVVMITTKKARSENATISVDAKWGLNTRAVRDYEYITDPALFYETHYKALKNYYLDSDMDPSKAHAQAVANLTGSANDGGLGYMVYDVPAGQQFIGLNGKINPNATLGRRLVYMGEEYWVQPDNWTDAAYRQSLRQEYNVNISGRTGKASIFGSFGYLNNEGIVYNSDMERYTARVKMDYQARKWLKFGANINYAHFTYNSIDDSGASNSSGNVFAYTTAVGPIYPLYMRDGNGNIMVDSNGITRYDYGNGDNAGMSRALFPNSNALSDSRLDKSTSEGNALNATSFFDISFLKDFKFTFNAGINLDETRSTSVTNPYYGNLVSENGLVGKSHSRILELNLQQVLNWTRQFGLHNVNVMVGHESYNSKSYGLSAGKSNMFSQENDELDGAITDKMSASSSRGEYNNEGYFSRVMYDYASKYYGSASYRRDASSRFHPSHRWGNFWSLGGAWIITRESFMDGARGWLDHLKFKASIGSQGNDNIGDFRYTNLYSIENANGQVSTVWSTKGAENITWETNTNINAGLEFGFLRGMISGGVEYFVRKTTDMLLSFPAPPSIGYSSYYANVGDMMNKGVELELTYTPISKENLHWDISLNMTHLRNEITMLPQERRNTEVDGYHGYVSGETFYGEGVPMYTFYMKRYAGVSPEGQSMWYVNELDENGNKTGNLLTTTEYSEASTYLCGNPIPDLYGGFSTSLNAYGFDFSIDFTYQIGGLAYDSGYAASMYVPKNKDTGLNWHKDILNAWSPENTSSNIPRLQYEDQNSNASSDRFLMDASYLNLQSITFGYTFPEKLTKPIHVQRLRLYLACENIWYWSRRQGFDPRHSYSGSTSQATYSPVRTISGGINFTF